MADWLILAALAASALAAGLGLRAALVHVRDNLDAFISDIHKQSRWATYAAVANAVATLLLIFATLSDSF